MLGSRLQKILSNLISKEKISFFLGRSIYDGIIIAQEVIHSIQNNRSPSMLIKLDISKAYDRVDWCFLCKCLEVYGFSKQ